MDRADQGEKIDPLGYIAAGFNDDVGHVRYLVKFEWICGLDNGRFDQVSQRYRLQNLDFAMMDMLPDPMNVFTGSRRRGYRLDRGDDVEQRNFLCWPH